MAVAGLRNRSVFFFLDNWKAFLRVYMSSFLTSLYDATVVSFLFFSVDKWIIAAGPVAWHVVNRTERGEASIWFLFLCVPGKKPWLRLRGYWHFPPPQKHLVYVLLGCWKAPNQLTFYIIIARCVLEWSILFHLCLVDPIVIPWPFFMSHSIDPIWGAITLPFTKCNVGQHCNPRESRLYRLFQRHKKETVLWDFEPSIQPPASGTWLNVSLAESGWDNLFVCLRWNSWLSRTYIVSVTRSPWIMSSLSRTRAEDATCHVLGPPATTPSTWKYTHQGSVSTILLARWLLLCSAVCFFFLVQSIKNH